MFLVLALSLSTAHAQGIAQCESIAEEAVLAHYPSYFKERGHSIRRIDRSQCSSKSCEIDADGLEFQLKLGPKCKIQQIALKLDPIDASR